jgi:outer membrane protein assembly factor BamA
VLRVTDVLTNEDGTRKVRPVFTPVSGGGLIFIQDNFLREEMRLRAAGSFGNRTRVNFYGGLRDTKLFSSKLGLQMEGFYKRVPDEDFFGIGNNSQRANETNYLHQETNFEIELVSQPIPRTLFAAGFSYSKVDIKDGRDPNKPSLLDSAAVFGQPIPGLLGAEMGTLLVRIYRDTRNGTGNPTRGGEAYFSYEYAREIGGSDLGCSKVTLDLRRYNELFYQRVLALRVRAEITDNIGAKEIPFYRLGGLGGIEVLRGYRASRFRDKDLLLAGAEYRFPIHPSVDAEAFLEEARVYSDIFDQFSLKNFKYSYGGGLRIKSRDGNLVALIEIARSREQLRFYFSLNKGLRKF